MPRYFKQMRNLAQVIDHDHHVGAFGGRSRSARPHGHSNIGGGQHRGVIDTVSDHHHRAFGHGSHLLHLFPGQQTGADIAHPDLGGNRLGGFARIAREHHGIAHLGLGQLSENAGSFGADFIGEGDVTK